MAVQFGTCSDHARSQSALPVFRQSRVAEKKCFGGAGWHGNGFIVSAGERPKSQFQPREETMFSDGSRILAVVAAVALFAGVQSIRAADFAGSVQGVVKSASGEALPGAYVKLINPERRLTFMVVSQAQGRYTMNNLPPGDYTVQGIGNGFPSKPTPVALTAGKPPMADRSLTGTQSPVGAHWRVRNPRRVASTQF